MKKVLILLALVILTLGTSLQDQQIEQGRKLLKQLNDVGDIGQDILQTIMLELTTSTNENVLDRVIKMLHDVKDSIEGQLGDFKQENEAKQSSCMSKVKDLQQDIEDLKERIEKAQLLIPPKQEQFDNKNLELQTLGTSLASLQKELTTLDQYAAEKLAKYQQSRDEHDSLVTALEAGRKIILQLKNEQPKAFLQEKRDNIFLQLDKHAKNTVNLAKHHKPLFDFVFSLVQKVEADQSAVDKVIQIIDDLIAAESRARNIEYQAEQLRLAKYEFDRDRYLASVANIKALSAEIEADNMSLKTRLEEQEKDIDGWRSLLKGKLQQVSDHNKICTQDASNLIRRIENYERILDILRQVIILMEHSSIQGVRGMVKDMDADAILNKKSASELIQKQQKKFDFTESDRIANTILADIKAIDSTNEDENNTEDNDDDSK